MNITNDDFKTLHAAISFAKHEHKDNEIILSADNVLKRLIEKKEKDNKRIASYIADKRKTNKDYANGGKEMTYKEKKEEIRQQAIDFQNSFADGQVYYTSELIDRTSYFETQGKRYGLLKEFKENGII